MSRPSAGRRRPFELANLPDSHSGLPVERGNRKPPVGVGSWVPGEKHKWLAKWIEGTSEMRARFPQRVFIDLFCGPGRIEVKDEGFTRLGGAAVAWVHSTRGPAPFTKCIVGDLDPERSSACEQRLFALGAPVHALAGPAELTVHEALAQVPPGALTLAFLDPYNLSHLSWTVIRALAQLKRVDFAVHFSTSDLFRNVRADFLKESPRFDSAAPGWRQAIDPVALARGDADEQFFDYWCGLVRGLGFTISERIPLVRADRNAPLYHLVMFSRNPGAVRVWSDVAQGSNRELF